MANHRIAALLFVFAGATAFLAWRLGFSADVTSDGRSAAPAETARMIDSERPATVARQPLERQQVEADARPYPVRVRAVLADTGEPAVGAEVWYVPRGLKVEHDALDHDLEATLRRMGARAQTDGLGLVDLVVEDESRLCVRLETLYGEVTLIGVRPDGISHYRVELAPDARLRVMVTDTAGQPVAGLPVELVGRHRDPWNGGLGSFDANLGVTDDAGVVEHLHLQCLIPWQERRSPEWQLNARVALDHLRANAGTVGEHAVVTGTPVRLVVPLAGNVEVRLVDDQDQPLAIDDRTLEQAFEHPQHGRVPQPEGTDPLAADAPVLVRAHGKEEPLQLEGLLSPSARVAVFPHVPLHATWQFVVQTDAIACRHQFVGPTRVGETVRVRIATDLVRCVLRGRVQLASGQPVSGADVFVFEAGVVDGECAPSDADGRFNVPLLSRRSLLPRTDGMLFVGSTPTTGAELVPLAKVDTGSNEVGAVVVPSASELPLLVTVRLTEDGRPIVDDVGLSVVARTNPRRAWATIQHRIGNAFEVRVGGPPPEGAVCLSATVNGRTLPRVAFERGSTLDITVAPPPTSLAVSIVPPTIPRGLLWATLDSTTSGIEPSAEGVAAAGVFTFPWRTLSPGAYTLRISSQHTVLYEVGLDLHSGHHLWPADGSAIDLRGRARELVVSAESAAGQPLTSRVMHQLTALVHAVPQSGDAEAMLQFGGNSFRNGRSAVVVESPPADVIVTALGHVPVRLTAPSVDVAIKLRPNAEIVLHPPADKTIVLHVRLVDDGLRDPLMRAADERTGGAASLRLDEMQQWTPSAAEPALRLNLHPDSVLEVQVVKDGSLGSVQRVVAPQSGVLAVHLR